MKRIASIKKCGIVALLVAMALGLACSGCQTNGAEASNESSRPWNSPEGWQNGALPGTMMQPR